MLVTVLLTDGSKIFEHFDGVFAVELIERVSLVGRKRVLFFNPSAVTAVIIDQTPSADSVAVEPSVAPADDLEERVRARFIDEFVAAWRAASPVARVGPA